MRQKRNNNKKEKKENGFKCEDVQRCKQYYKIADSVRKRCDINVVDLRTYYMLYMCYVDYVTWVPVVYMPIESVRAMKEYIRHLFEREVFKHIDKIVDLFKSRSPRMRASYVQILIFLMRHAHIIPSLDKATFYMYREIVRETSYAFSTVRDAWSYISRYAGWR